ncbi:MAG: cadmium-translocating P-type ATPase, partial [Alphaproteobacteria bacterium]|nr:cadmium-translocating P-type ATPase [Alphaproteobacteria bacterium]
RAIDEGDGVSAIHLLVEGVHCANCISKIERTLSARPDVIEARVNFSTRRLLVRWQGPPERADEIVAAVEALGFGAIPFDPTVLAGQGGAEGTALLRAMGVAGFAAANVMLLSVSVWAGLWSDMDATTRDLLHWISALIALPAIAYAGRPFFRSAVSALRARRTNMDVPISLAVILAAAVSLVETIGGGVHAYFDASVTLLFFLLVGRYLDQRARAEARRSAERLLLLRATSAAVEQADGSVAYLPVEQLDTEMTVRVMPGERFPVDGKIVRGTTGIDASLVTGESLPADAGPGANIFAGTMNLGAAVSVRVGKIGDDTLLAEIARLVESAEQGRAAFVRLADRVSRWYAPVVHALAAATFAGWIAIAGAPWQVALLHAVAVLIITCPCALGLAVPVVQVVASGRLLSRGVLLRTGDALERLATVDTIVFDKTGTLTRGKPEWVNRDEVATEFLEVAAQLASASNHPLSRALQAALGANRTPGDATEVPGCGVTGTIGRQNWRLGRHDWCGAESNASERRGPEIWLSRDGVPVARFAFADALRHDAPNEVKKLIARGYRIELLSGDHPEIVQRVAEGLGIAHFRGGATPAEKVAHLRALERDGRRVMMVGDGLNDAPALAAAHVSISPSSAADISQVQADLVFQGDALSPVRLALETGRFATNLTRQNIALAIVYNAIAVPFAVLGFVTPLVAAVAMSSSSLLVTLNALRLRIVRKELRS